MNLELLKSTKPTWPEVVNVDMRRKKNKLAFKAARTTGHIKRVPISTNSFSGVRMAWTFSNELLAQIP